MSRKVLINIHLFLASFFAPVLILIAISGGSYLLGFKGETETEVVYTSQPNEIDFTKDKLLEQVVSIFEKQGFDYETIRPNGDGFYTRPTSQVFYVVDVKNEQLEITRRTPDLVKQIVELHKGHGPELFKLFQKVVAGGLLLILISGLWLGLTSPSLKTRTMLISASGLMITLLLAML